MYVGGLLCFVVKHVPSHVQCAVALLGLVCLCVCYMNPVCAYVPVCICTCINISVNEHLCSVTLDV